MIAVWAIFAMFFTTMYLVSNNAYASTCERTCWLTLSLASWCVLAFAILEAVS